MRRTLATLPALALLAGGFVGGLPAVPAAASDVTTVWQLVSRTCVSGEVQVGQACFEGAGHGDQYDSISDSAAQGKDLGYVNNYTYALPETIAIGQPSHVELGAMVSQVSDGGAHSRICVSGSFAHGGTDEPCATTAEAPNGQSASASHTVALLPYAATSGDEATVTVGFEEPGGYLHYSYIASNPQSRIEFSFSLHRKLHDRAGGTAHVTLSSDGHFVAAGLDPKEMHSKTEAGSAVYRLTRGNGDTRTAHLKLVSAIWNDDGRLAELSYRVVKSTLKCAPVGVRHDVDAKNHGFIRLDPICQLKGRVDVGEDDLKVSVTES